MFWCVREEYPCNFSAEIYIIFSTHYYLLISVDDSHALYQGRKRKNKLLKWIFFLPKKPILHMDDPVHTFVSFSLKVQQQNTWVNGLMDFDLSSLIWSRSVHHQSVIWLELVMARVFKKPDKNLKSNCFKSTFNISPMDLNMTLKIGKNLPTFYSCQSQTWNRIFQIRYITKLDLPLNVFSRWKMTFGFNKWMYILEKKFVRGKNVLLLQQGFPYNILLG